MQRLGKALRIVNSLDLGTNVSDLNYIAPYVYVSGANGVTQIDATSPSTPIVRLPRLTTSAGSALATVQYGSSLYIADGENYELTAAGKVGLHLVLIRNSAQDNGTELLREAREWQGDSIGSMTEVLLRVRD